MIADSALIRLAVSDGTIKHEPTDQSFFDLAASLANRSAFRLQVFTQRDLLLLVFGQRAIRWTEYVVGVIFAFTHDVTLSNCRVPVGLSQMASQ